VTTFLCQIQSNEDAAINVMTYPGLNDNHNVSTFDRRRQLPAVCQF